jgi:molybdenum cofactor cytidylyltransferase
MAREPAASKRGGPSVVVLAAGTSSRFLGTKQLADIGGKTLVQRTIDVVPQDKVKEVIVVVGHQAASVSKVLHGRTDVRIVVNKNYREGIGSSIRAGVFAVASGTRGVMLLLADQPFITRALLRRLTKAFDSESGSQRIVAAARGEVVSPPVIFSRKYFPELVALYGDHGAKFVILRHLKEVTLVRIRSPSLLADVDTQDDLLAARRLLLKARKAR